jgi:hypothetical protein
MSDKPKSGAPPYATFSSLLSFFNKLCDTSIPSRIDPSVFGNASSSLSYSIIATLKFLKLIDADGAPSKTFIDFVHAADEARKPMMATLVREGYPSFFGGPIDLAKATAAQLDEHIRKTYDSSGSTVDKIAAFFIAAASFAGIELSHHIKNRKPTYVSASAGKSKKQRRATEEDEEAETPTPLTAAENKALEYHLIDLLKSDEIGEGERSAIWTLVQFLAKKKAAA